MIEHKPFPKRSTGDVDKERVRAQYLESKHIQAAAFCREQTYNLDDFKCQMPFKSWRTEKIQLAVEENVETIEEKGIQVRHQLILQQLEFVEKLPKTVASIHGLLEYLIRKHTQAVIQDIQDEKDGKNLDPEWRPKSTLTPDDVNGMSLAAQRLITAAHRSTFLNSDDTAAIIEIFRRMKRDEDAQAVDSIGQDDSAIELLGIGTVSKADMLEHMTKWFDNPRPKPEQIAYIAPVADDEPEEV